MIPTQNRGRPCKFGNTCRNFQQGKCTFLHDANTFNNTNFNNSNFNNNNQHGNKKSGMGNPGNKNQPFYQPKPNYHNNDGALQQFCRYFQVSECKNGSNCKKLHQFTKGNILRRVLKTTKVPNNQVSRLCLLNINNSNFFVLRLGSIVTFFRYNSQTSQITELQNQNFTLEYPNIHFFDSHEKYVYFAYENQNTSFSNIGFIDVETKQRITVDNAHKLKVTGIIHIHDNNNHPFILSSSLDGTIKVWKIEGEKMILHQQINELINNCFKSNSDLQVLFLSKENVSGGQVISAGTSDNRLLLWVGNEMKFQQVVFKEPYNKVLSIKYVQTETGQYVAVAIVWSANNSMSALIAISLHNMQYQALLQEEIVNERQLISSIEAVGKLFLVANLTGLVNIYKVPDFKNKVGSIMHNNRLADMLSSSSITSTNIQMRNLFILQTMEGGREGSFSVFSLVE